MNPAGLSMPLLGRGCRLFVDRSSLARRSAELRHTGMHGKEHCQEMICAGHDGCLLARQESVLQGWMGTGGQLMAHRAAA